MNGAILITVIRGLLFTDTVWGWGELMKGTALFPSSSQSSGGGTNSAQGRSAQATGGGLQMQLGSRARVASWSA